MAIAVWSAGEAFAITSVDKLRALWLWRLNHIGVIFIPIFFVHFVTSLLSDRERERSRILVLVSYALATLFVVLDIGGVLITEVVPKFHFNYFINSTPVYPFFFCLWVSWAIYGLIRLLRLYLNATPARKNQLGYFSISMLVAYMGGIPNFLPTFNMEIPFLMPFGTYAIPIYGSFTAYAIVRFRFMDIELALTRTTILLLLYAVILGVPTILVFGGRARLVALFGTQWWVVPLALYSAMTAIGPFLYTFFGRKAEERLLREQRQYQQTLLQASRGMTLIKDLNHLLNLVVHMLTRTIRITHASIYLYDEEGGLYEPRAQRASGFQIEAGTLTEQSPLINHLKETKEPVVAEELALGGPYERSSSLAGVQTEVERLNAAVVIPSFVREKLIGFLVLGEKKSKQIYTQDDLNTLSTLANQAALAIENCNFIQEVETTQAQLFQAAKMADLGTMASGIGHQINNRLHAIKLGADVGILVKLQQIRQALTNGKSDEGLVACEAFEKNLKDISDSAKRGGEIVSRLLNFSRLSEGFRPVSIPEALDQCVKLWECKRDLSQIHFEREIHPGLPQIIGNHSQIEEVLFNLLDNAFDAIKLKEEAWQEGRLAKPSQVEKGKILFKAASLQRNGKGFVKLEVQDTGVGMTPETIKKLFVPFFTTKATSIKGTGLGLYVIKRMVDAHRGEIEVESQYGEGTTFRILLPLERESTA